MADHEPCRGFIDARGRMTWDYPSEVCSFLRRRFAEKRVEVLFRLEDGGRTKAQSDGFHAMITPWARERGWDIDTMKQWLLREVFGTVDFVDPRTGRVVVILAEPHTSSLTKAQFNELIERTLQLGAEDHYELTPPDEWRRQQEERAQKASARQRRTAPATAP